MDDLKFGFAAIEIFDIACFYTEPKVMSTKIQKLINTILQQITPDSVPFHKDKLLSFFIYIWKFNGADLIPPQDVRKTRVFLSRRNFSIRKLFLFDALLKFRPKNIDLNSRNPDSQFNQNRESMVEIQNLPLPKEQSARCPVL